jgi:hypothetical protein
MESERLNSNKMTERKKMTEEELFQVSANNICHQKSGIRPKMLTC